MAYWLVGEFPTREVRDDPSQWLTPDDSGVDHPANFLLKATGWSEREFLAIFPHRTCLWRHAYDMADGSARRRATDVAEESRRDQAGVVLLGLRAAAAFWLRDSAPFEWHGRYAIVPLPAPRSTFWKAPEHLERAANFFEDIRCAHYSLRH